MYTSYILTAYQSDYVRILDEEENQAEQLKIAKEALHQIGNQYYIAFKTVAGVNNVKVTHYYNERS